MGNYITSNRAIISDSYLSRFLKKAHFKAINLVFEGVRMGVKAVKMRQNIHISSNAISRWY